MPKLSERIDMTSWQVVLLPMPKGKKYGIGLGFCDGLPVGYITGAGYSAPPQVWMDAKPVALSFQDLKKLSVSGARGKYIVGSWMNTKGEPHALCWHRQPDGSFNGVELHPPTWEQSSALGCGDGQQIGFGYENFMKSPCRALLWSGSAASLVLLAGPDPERETYATATAQGIQVGHYGGGRSQHAVLWRGTTQSMVDLHPVGGDFGISEAAGVGDGEQVGMVWGKGESQPVMWRGTADSFVNLLPQGYTRGRARICSRGIQGGWVSKTAGMIMHAAVWGGSAEDFIDLHSFVPPEWNASWINAIEISGNRLRLIGDVQNVINDGRYEMNGGQRPAIWEAKLLVAEPEAPVEPPIVLSASAPTEASAETAEKRVQRFGSMFGQGIIDGDYQAAQKMLASWLQNAFSPQELQTFFQQSFIDGVKPADCEVNGNNTTLDDLRKTEYGVPSQPISDAITAANFRQWMSITFTPDPDQDSGLDYCLELWLIAVEENGEMKAGYLESAD